MDFYKEIKDEIQLIQATITSCTSQPRIQKTLQFLVDAIEEKNTEEILKNLKKLEKWYSNNINSILQNDFVFDKDEHIESFDYIKNIIAKMEGNQINFENEKQEMNKKTVFISHSSDDKILIDKFVEQLEKLNCEIFYSSKYSTNPLHNGKEFIQSILESIKKSEIVIACISKNFYKSIYAQIEMGMAFSNNRDIQPIILNQKVDFNQDLRGIFNSHTQALHIYSKDNLIQLFEYIDKGCKAIKITELSNQLISRISEIDLGSIEDPKNNIHSSTNKFKTWCDNGIINKSHLYFLKYIVDTGRLKFEYGWQIHDGIANFSEWGNEKYGDIEKDYHTIYNDSIQTLEALEVIEPSKFTKFDNIKEYKIKTEFINELFSFINSSALS